MPRQRGLKSLLRTQNHTKSLKNRGDTRKVTHLGRSTYHLLHIITFASFIYYFFVFSSFLFLSSPPSLPSICYAVGQYLRYLCTDIATLSRTIYLHHKRPKVEALQCAQIFTTKRAAATQPACV